MSTADVQRINEKVKNEFPHIGHLVEEISKTIVGQRHLLERLIIGLLADGHILVEGMPGLAKTTAIKSLAEAIHCSFGRVQFTPDLLPADLVGTQIYSPKEENFKVKFGPIFANIILADEINRAPAKVQSALLEAMQEKQVTIGDKTYPLPLPFLVMATQNPVEQEGTYPLPEAQLDRFMLKVKITYPEKQEEIQIMKRVTKSGGQGKIAPILTPQKISELKDLVEEIFVDDKLYSYVADLVFATRYPDNFGLKDLKNLIEYGASPRASINLIKASKVQAFLAGRGFVTPQDIKNVAHDVLRHRVAVTYEAEAQSLSSEDVITRILDKVDVP